MATTDFEPEAPVGKPAGLGFVGWLRWTWRQLTSMRIALILLFLLAVASVPGSLLPQRGLNAFRVKKYLDEHTTIGPIFDRLSLFDVFAAPWFGAIYLLLFISLAGCVIPRAWHHAREMRARPPRAPRRLERLPVSRATSSDDEPSVVLAEAAKALKKRRFRVDIDETDGSVSGEKGYLRETGNLVFHLSLLVLLVAVAIGSAWGYHGNVLVREKSGFANTVTQYESFVPGKLFGSTTLAPFSFTLEDFTATYEDKPGFTYGAPRSFDAKVTVRDTPTSEPYTKSIRSNYPLNIDGTKIFLVGHGYAPRFTVRDGKGNVVFHDSVPFLPQDGNFTSTGVVKVPDALPEQLGFVARFLPTTTVDEKLGPISTFPAPNKPSVFMAAFKGNLGLDSGKPQSIYTLDTQALGMKQVGFQALEPGQTLKLEGGVGSIRFDGYEQFATFSVAKDPGKGLALAAVIAMIIGLMLSLGIRRRRVWVRAVAGEDGRTVVTVGGLGRTESAPVEDDVRAVMERLDPEADAQESGEKELADQ